MNLYQFQQDYLKDLPSKFIFAADTGTGKTIMALAHYRHQAYPKKLLILGPAAKMRTGDWEKHIEEYFYSESTVAPEAHYYSYEKFSRNPTVKEYKKHGKQGVWKQWLRDNPPGTYAVIADEVHRAANPQSGIGKAVYELARCSGFFVGLSATPAPNGWISVANYFKMFGFTPNVTAFKNRYCNIQTFKGFPEIVGYYYEDEIKTLWNRISKPLKKEDAIDLPDLVDVPVNVPTDPAYVKVEKERIFGGTFLDNPSALLHALRQSTIEPKLPWLDEFLEGTSSNVVIFYTYVAEREAILKMLKKKHPKRAVFRQDGEKHELPHKGDWPDLKRTITLAQYQSGSTGVEMTYADTIVFFSPTYSYTLYHQAIGRIERIGQKAKMTLYSMCAPATIESAVWRAIRNKQDFSEKIWIEENLTNKQ